MTAAQQVWDAWAQNQAYGDLMRRRALGVEPEMESAKELVRMVQPIYRPGLSILDVGCGGGHFVRSLRRLDPEIEYTGLDFTDYYVAVAQDVWRGHEHVHFLRGDLFNLPAASESFDIVTCVTVLQNLPEFQTPLAEMMRVSRRAVLVRTLLGEISHLVKRYEHPERPEDFSYYNIWNSEAVVDELYRLGARKVELLPEKFGAKLSKNGPTSTYTYGDLQINGNLVMTWKWIRVSK